MYIYQSGVEKAITLFIYMLVKPVCSDLKFKNTCANIANARPQL